MASECICGADQDQEMVCECAYQTVEVRPEDWYPFIRQKPFECFEPKDKTLIYVKSLELYGAIVTNENEYDLDMSF